VSFSCSFRDSGPSSGLAYSVVNLFFFERLIR
jgi:hypothetical protein